MKCANTEINFTPERLVEIAQLAIDGLRCDDEDSAMEYFADMMELTDYEREFFGIPAATEDDDDDEPEYMSREWCEMEMIDYPDEED